MENVFKIKEIARSRRDLEPREICFKGLKTTDLEKLRICVHCGLCLEACPTYRLSKNEADSPRGRIALMRAHAEERIRMNETVFQHLDACLNCRACETACPAGVPYGELIEEGRSELYPLVPDYAGKEKLKKFILTRILAYPGRLNLLAKIFAFYQRCGFQYFLRKSKILKLFPSWLEKGEALLPQIPSLRAVLPHPGIRNGSQLVSRPGPTVALFRGCIAPILFPEVEEAALRVLESLGCSVIIPENQICCGALLSHGGLKEEAKKLALANIEAFSRNNCDFIVATAAGCGSTLKEYGRILLDLPLPGDFSGKILDFSQMVIRLGFNVDLKPLKLRVAYQDACHLIHAQKIREEPRKILNAIPNLELVDVPHSDWCCGSAGIYNITHQENSERILDEKIKSVLSVAPDAVCVANPGCALQIQMGLKRTGRPVPVLHPAQLLYRSLCG